MALNMPMKGAVYLQDAIVQEMARKVRADVYQVDALDYLLLAHENQEKGKSTLVTTLMEDEYSGDVRPQEEEEVLVYNISHDRILLGQAVREAGQRPLTKTERLEHNELRITHARYTSLFERILTHKTSKDTEQKTPTIVYLRDYGDTTDKFTTFMTESLVAAVESLRKKKHPIVIVSGHSFLVSSSEYKMEISERINEQGLSLVPGMKIVSVLPPLYEPGRAEVWHRRMDADEERRTIELNSKHILAVQKYQPIPGLQPLKGTRPDLMKAFSEIKDLGKLSLTMEHLYRIVTMALGSALEGKKKGIEMEDIQSSYATVHKNVTQRKTIVKLMEDHHTSFKVKGDLSMDALREKCDSYETRILSRIVDPAKIQCTFDDVRASPETIDTLKTVISLPLMRPDLFQHGILKRNFISGLLLFGPPGTGKTMLAKAVAKESGSRMLEIQASDIFDMYVGEGEKNVRAIFSLARKLSPCVIFIDEVDSLMGNRGADNKNVHREIINQIMVEWDGLSSENQGVVIMAATNRPFDLDDAMLRRMPQRILVDLPKEEDRSHILTMLLREEHHEIVMSELAKATEHYSGSDLKNLCVTAALKAVQQQVLTGEKHPLRWEHFKEAMKQVTASANEDSHAFLEIRKWAKAYGDARKKTASIGFA
ncbi:P-loop containing nucleoside triphosphate hydrolase protein [Spinellus fusiger]|nr:P-loop containing nucleoside triphosphate hydrolase protein [Spinellus fusiger]